MTGKRLVCHLKAFSGSFRKSAHWDREQFAEFSDRLADQIININVAHSRVTHGNGVLSFETEYDFAWEEEPSKSSLDDLPTPVSPAPWMIYRHQDDDDLFKPIYGNQLPMNKKGGPQYPVKSYYQLVEPRLYDGSKGADVRELYR